MKFIYAFALLFSHTALAAPDYSLPENAARSQMNCTTVQVVMEKTETGWTGWRTESMKESFARATWFTGNAYNLFEDRGTLVRRMQITDRFAGPERTDRTEKVEEWSMHDGQWQLVAYTVEAALYRRPGAPVRRVETRQGSDQTFFWDLATSLEEGVVTQKRILRNPSALNSSDRKFNSFDETCVH